MRVNRETGVSFWGCHSYPKCKGGLDYARWRRDADATFKKLEAPSLTASPPILMASPSPEAPPVQAKPQARTRRRRVPEDA